VNQKLAVAILEKAGHTVKVVGDGREALLQLEKNGFDLVLMDVQMPELDGLETTAEIRRREGEGGGHTSIIAMTAYAAPEDRRRCLAAGMDEYTTKPLKTEELFRLIDKICGGVADAAVAETELPPGDGSSDRSIVMDYDTAMSHMGDDADLLKEVADVFLQGCGQQMTDRGGDFSRRRREGPALRPRPQGGGRQFRGRPGTRCRAAVGADGQER
jgi:two-component system sensor histidine kinase/response regulator